MENRVMSAVTVIFIATDYLKTMRLIESQCTRVLLVNIYGISA